MDDERLSSLDTAFLRLESPEAPMQLGALAIFDPREPIPPAQLAAVLAERVTRIPSLRRRLRAAWLPPGGAAWTADTTFDLARHLHFHELSPDAEAPAALASELMAEPLDLCRPLWQLHLMTGLPEGRFAMLIKLHHAMADGLRTVELGLRLLDGFADRRPGRPDHGEPEPAAAAPSTVPAAQTSAERAFRTARAVTGVAIRGILQLPRAFDLATSTVSIAASVLSHVRLAALLPSALGNPDHGSAVSPADRPATVRRLALVRLDTRDVRQVRRRHGGTEHDVLLAVITGALRRWLIANDRCSQGLGFRAFIPVSRRSRTDGPQRHNVLSGYLCDLPIHQDGPRKSQLQRAHGTTPGWVRAVPHMRRKDHGERRQRWAERRWCLDG